MIRSAARPSVSRLLAPRLPLKTHNARRFLSTSPSSHKSGSWKSSTVRWAIAAGVVYYYNTSSVFAEQPDVAISKLENSIHHVQESNLPTLEALAAEKRERQAERQAQEAKAAQAIQDAQAAQTVPDVDGTPEEPGSVESLEEEADQQGAFNPETGEINWECPCLGGMAHGPCGEEFKAAFSCFVYSKEEPKGMECIDRFKCMQECFRAHPDIYGSELEDEEDEIEEELIAAASSQQTASAGEATPNKSTVPDGSKTTARRLPEPDEAVNSSKSVERSEKAEAKGAELVQKAKEDDPQKQ